MTRPVLRCAIYTRVSSDQGLEQDFNSLHAQREAAEAYIKSQAHEGWKLHRDRYDDGGFSGGSMERPALQKLLANLAEGRIDVIVVYKVDRLTRSLSDFAKLVEIFEANKVSFVSVTQSFNTTSSMGRLTLNVLLSFAQFEREVTSERIRDKIAASKKKGIWMGGVVPLGYRVENRKLLVCEAEAEIVRLIFQRYLDLGSLPALQRDLLERGVRTRSRTLTSGRTIGNVPLTNGPLAHILKNRLYLGEINHHGASYPSDHAPIIATRIFEAVQARITENLNRTDLRKTKTGALLTGRIFDDRGNLMSPSFTTKKGVRYRYYVSTTIAQGRLANAGAIRRVSASQVEAIVLATVGKRITGPDVGNELSETPSLDRIDLRVRMQSEALEISWKDEGPTGSASHHDDPDAIGDSACHRVIVPYVASQRTRRREIILPTNASGYMRPIEQDEQQRLVHSIARGQAWLRDVLSGATTYAVARREGKSERSIRLGLSLAFLDPKLVKAAIQGNLPRGVSTRRLLDAPTNWHEQWLSIGLSRPA